jgi:hypothetical protein
MKKTLHEHLHAFLRVPRTFIGEKNVSNERCREKLKPTFIYDTLSLQVLTVLDIIKQT